MLLKTLNKYNIDLKFLDNYSTNLCLSKYLHEPEIFILK